MAFEKSSEQNKPGDASQQAPRFAWAPSVSEYQGMTNSSIQSRGDANQAAIQSGFFNDLVIDFGDEPILAQASHYRDYPTTQSTEPTHQSLFQAPFTSPNKLITGESNQPNISGGVKDLNSAGQLFTGIIHEGLKALDFMSKPAAINDSIISLGPVLDTAMNYYTNPDKVSHIQQDASQFTASGLNQVDQVIDKLSHPMDQNEVGHNSAAMSPWFLYGLKKPVPRAAAIEAGGLTLDEAGNLSKSELIDKLGAAGVEWTEQKYRDVFFQGHPELVGFEDQIVVHHAIEQQVLEEYPGLFTAGELNDLRNLRGIPKDIDDTFHKGDLRKDWDSFYRKYPPGCLSRDELRTRIIEHAAEIDRIHGKKFEPPQ